MQENCSKILKENLTKDEETFDFLFKNLTELWGQVKEIKMKSRYNEDED